MRASQFLISTLKEAPAEAEIVSHQLMLRAGMIKQLAAGIYTFLPLGLRVLRKIETIVREEMNAAGAVEILMPVVQPAELWQRTSRWEKYGAELLRIKDRHERDFVLQPTSEEVVTSIAASEIRSRRQLPLNLYHIQTKFRDERRPRFGVMRSREFIMKDAYSFDTDLAGLQQSYKKMYDAYIRIFNRFGLRFRAVEADNGAIGGTGSQEFHVLAKTGEDALAYCPTSNFAANVESAAALPAIATRATAQQKLEKVLTPNCTKCETVAAFLKLPLEQNLKSIVIAIDRPDQAAEVVLLLLRADHQLNEVKVGKLKGLSGFRLANGAEIEATFGSPPGYLGPVGLAQHIRVIADSTVVRMSDFVCGANQADYHYRGVNWGRDLPEPEVADIRNVVEGDASPCGGGVLAIDRGIEVGHIFQLGTRYSIDLDASFLDEAGNKQPMQMGCYGIGVSRIIGAAIEQNFDDKGIIWGPTLAPFHIVLCPIGSDKSSAVAAAAEKIYSDFHSKRIEVILDDRNLRPGVMFADWELVGVPLRVVVSERSLAQGVAEVQGRRDSVTENIKLDNLTAFCQDKLAKMAGASQPA